MNDNRESQKQPRKREKCPYGFDCSSFMLIAGMIAHDCENLGSCKELSGTAGRAWYDPNQPTFDLVMYYADEQQDYEQWAAEYAERQRQQEIWREEMRRYRRVIVIRQHEAATLMLKTRGNHQEYESFGLEELASSTAEVLGYVNNDLERLAAANDNTYIAPDGIEAHVYNVKRPPRNSFPDHWTLQEVRQEQNIYYYHKITSKEAQFRGMEKDDDGNFKSCKVIHLSHSDNARNIQGRLGIERRNKLNKIRTKLQQARQLLIDAKLIAQEEYSFEDILTQSQEAANELDVAELQADEQQNPAP